MDWSYILDIVLKAVGSCAAGIFVTLASILFAKLKAKIADSKLIQYINEAVKAAEQLYPNLGTQTGTEKYAYVLNLVLEKFPTLTENEYLKSLIEGAVYTITNAVDGTTSTSEEKKVEQATLKISI